MADLQDYPIASEPLKREKGRFKKLLRANWWVLLLGFGLGVLGDALWLWHLPPTYVSSARMAVNLPPVSPNGVIACGPDPRGSLIEIITSQVVRNRVLLPDPQIPVMAKGPVTLKATIIPKTTAFQLQAFGNNPVLVRRYLETTMEEFLKFRAEMIQDATTNAIADLKAESWKLKIEIAQTKTKLSVNPSTNTTSVALKENLQKLQNEDERVQKEIQGLNESLQNPVDDTAVLSHASTAERVPPKYLKDLSLAGLFGMVAAFLLLIVWSCIRKRPKVTNS